MATDSLYKPRPA